MMGRARMDEPLRSTWKPFLCGVLVGLLLAAGGYVGFLREVPPLRKTAQGPFGEGRILVMEGRFEEAIPVLEGYLQSAIGGRNRSRACLFLGKALMGLGRYEEARKLFEESLQSYPHSLEAQKYAYKIACIDSVSGDKRSARTAFAAIVADPSPGVMKAEARLMHQLLSDEEDSTH